MTSVVDRWDKPDEWNAYLAEGNARQPRKRVAADVVLRDAAGRVLLVDPTYKPDWDLPGGMVEANEAPRAAAERELREELGLDRHVGAVLCADWVPPLTEDQIRALDPSDGELRGYAFWDEREVERLVRPRLWRRLRLALHTLTIQGALYLEDGNPGLPDR